VQSTLCLPVLSNPSLVAQIGVNLPCRCICIQTKTVPASLPLNINIGLCLPKALTLSRLRLYEMFEVSLIVRINKTMGLRPARRRVSVPAGKSDSSQGGSSVASSIQGQNSTPSSSLNNSRVADITQRVASNLSAKH